MFRRNLCTVFILSAIVIPATACSFWPTRGGEPSSGQKGPAQEGPITEEMVDGWQPVTGMFSTDAQDPLLLARTGADVLYVQNNRLLFAEYGGDPSILTEWNGPLDARAWSNGPIWLIGFQTPGTSPEPRSWLAVRLDRLAAGLPTAEKLDAFFKPGDVLEVKMVDEPRLVFLTVKNASSYSEFAYGTSEDGFMTVNFTTPVGVGLDEIREKKPDPAAQTEEFDRQASFPTSNGTVYAFEDERGTVIYYERPDFYLWRYFDHRPLAFRAYQDIDGERYVLAQLETYGGTRVLSLLNCGFRSYLADEPRLISQEGWHLLEGNFFYRLGNDSIETMGFATDLEIAEPVYGSYVLPDASSATQDDSLLRYAVGGHDRYLSLFDLVNYRPRDSRGNEFLSLDDLWLYPVEPDRTESGTRPMSYEVGRKQVSLPRLEGSDYNGDPPMEVLEAVGKSYPDDDTAVDPRFRKIDDTWYALVGLELNVYRNGQFELVTTIPGTRARTIGEGTNIYGPRDYTFLNGSWYVADTFGNMILRLDDKFEVVDKYPLPVPSRLQANGGNLVVTSLRGQTILTPNLAVVSETAPAARPVTDPVENRTVPEDQYYEDQEQGLIWLFDDSGFLYQYRPASNDYRWFYIGREENAHAMGRVVPYRDRVLVFLDNRAFIFARDGKWLKTIEYPRATPDGIYVMSPPGENTYYLDEEGGMLYLVQGFRVLEVNLENGDTETLFMQANSRMGRLLARDGHLYVSAQVESVGGFRDPTYTELIVYDLATDSQTRFITEGVYETDSLTESQLVLWQRSADQGTEQGTAAYFDLTSLQAPAVALPFPVDDLLDADTVLFTNVTGKKGPLASADRDEFFDLLGQAVFESSSFPERDTGGGIVGRLTLSFKGENPVSVDVHDDFLWFDHQAYSLDASKVDQLLDLFD